MGRREDIERLERLREDVERALSQHDLAAEGNEAGDGHHHPAEAASDAELREHDLREQLRLRDQKARLEKALAAIGEGTYGICQDCGDQIPEGRLRAVPGAVRCVPCQSKAARRP
jgi:DnaK suppressor protein